MASGVAGPFINHHLVNLTTLESNMQTNGTNFDVFCSGQMTMAGKMTCNMVLADRYGMMGVSAEFPLARDGICDALLTT